MRDSFRRLSYRLLAGGLFAVLLASALLVGFELGLAQMTVVAQPEAIALEAEHLALVAERDALREELAVAGRELVISERNRKIDRETARALTDQLKEAQEARLDLNREISYLKRLVQEGGRGALRARDLRLARAAGSKAFRYDFSVIQLVPGLGSSVGQVRFQIEGRDGTGPVVLPLSDLPRAEPRALPVELQHLQSLSGTFELPDDFEPTGILIGIESSDDRLIPTAESFPWTPTTDE
jgi:hypothetical protein